MLLLLGPLLMESNTKKLGSGNHLETLASLPATLSEMLLTDIVSLPGVADGEGA